MTALQVLQGRSVALPRWPSDTFTHKASECAPPPPPTPNFRNSRNQSTHAIGPHTQSQSVHTLLSLLPRRSVAALEPLPAPHRKVIGGEAAERLGGAQAAGDEEGEEGVQGDAVGEGRVHPDRVRGERQAAQPREREPAEVAARDDVDHARQHRVGGCRKRRLQQRGQRRERAGGRAGGGADEPQLCLQHAAGEKQRVQVPLPKRHQPHRGADEERLHDQRAEGAA
mmetsp:Transcript_39154/g.120419  ORF Transcript_39154/g.120419 Transcript_39154/m.120419 type:complete len:226 (+) Transcript_39154:3-680(+)